MLADIIRKDIADNPLHTPAGTIRITSSFGVIEAGPEHGTLKEMLSLADKALYSSKHNGRNAIHLFRGRSIMQYVKV